MKSLRPVIATMQEPLAPLPSLAHLCDFVKWGEFGKWGTGARINWAPPVPMEDCWRCIIQSLDRMQSGSLKDVG